MKRLLFLRPTCALLLVLVLCQIGAWSQSTGRLEVTKNVNLRHDPSTLNAPIRLLRPTERFELIEPDQRDGYYHVRVEGVGEGWVWSRNVRIVQDLDSSDNDLISDPASGIANHISKDWPKAIPNRSTFFGIEGPCAFDGDGSDPVQFTLKNRTDIPTGYHDVSWEAIEELEYPRKPNRKSTAPMQRKDWNPQQLAIIQQYESIPLRVVGYLVAIKPQNGSMEGTNCDFHLAGDVDAHLALVGTFGMSEAQSVVIEWTPRFLKGHPNWTKAKLLPWLNVEKKVRVSGWLLFDPNHSNHIGRFRNTLWEVHPITEIEVEVNGNFVDLDTLP